MGAHTSFGEIRQPIVQAIRVRLGHVHDLRHAPVLAVFVDLIGAHNEYFRQHCGVLPGELHPQLSAVSRIEFGVGGESNAVRLDPAGGSEVETAERLEGDVRLDILAHGQDSREGMAVLHDLTGAATAKQRNLNR